MKKRKVMKGVLAAALATTLVSQFAYTAVNANMLDDSDLENKNVVEPEAWGAVPNEAQLQYHEEELAAFVHFGMNTFTDKEWGDGQEDPLSFNPTGDIATYADSYVEALKNAGFKRLIVTAKHHDGFCIWPSAYTEHDIENSPYKDGKGDVLAEISAACTKHNMDMGLYLSPWDVNAESYGYYDEKLKNAFVTKNAVAIDYSQGDSLFLHADTLSMHTFHLDTDSMYREVRAYHKVRFYRTDVQGVADSLVFSSKDSCLIMYKDPVLWNENQQLLGEQINIYMNDSTIDWAHIINQALSVEQVPVDTTLFNQISGKEIKAYFEDGLMEKVEVIGSVRLVYYPMDSDSLLIGMNVSETSQLDIYLENQQLERMVMSPKSNGTLYPMSQIPLEKSHLDNFVWFDYIRPLNKKDIFIWRGKKVEDQLKKNVRGPIELPNQHLFNDK